MIELTRGDILNADVEALVNTVNCVGVMGRGIALQFQRAFPDMFRAYEAACRKGELRPGTVQTYDLNRLDNPRYVINLPTKKHWKGKSRIEDIESGLQSLVSEVRRLNLRSVAIPPLGCGLGGLEWRDVLPRIRKAFGALPDVQVLVYEPMGAPSSEEIAKFEKRPKMTMGRASLLGLMRRYLAAVMDPFVTLLEIHKLMYFMQEAGQKLDLKYSKGTYGPYAENLRHVLKLIDGHFISGYGDASDRPDKEIQVKLDALIEAEEFLKDHPQVREHFDRVADVIDGFETAFSMELLATVHWVATREGAVTPEEVIDKTYAWGDRKRMFQEEDILIALKVLRDKEWLVA